MKKILLLIPLVVGCASNPSEQGRSTTQQFEGSAVRYGTVAALTGGGAAAGNLLTKGSTAGTIAGGAGGLALGVGGILVGDSLKDKDAAYNMERGRQSAISEILDDDWKRNAIYNVGLANGQGKAPLVRSGYVPSRTVNGVQMAGQYQDVYVAPK